MPAMPPARAVPLLRTLRRVTVVMDSSLGDALAGLTPAWIPFQTIGASVIQRMRKFARAQRVVSTIICWCFHASGAGGDFDVKQVDSSQSRHCKPAHEPYRHTGTLPAPQWYCRRRASFPRLIESLVPQCWRDVIVAGRSRKSSTGFDAPAIVSSRVSESARAAPDHRLHAADEVVVPACYPAAAAISCGEAVR